jgi:hypothetical protein
MLEVAPEVGWRLLIQSEVQAVCAALRKNARWSGSHAFDAVPSQPQLRPSRSAQNLLNRANKRESAIVKGVGPQLFAGLKAELRDLQGKLGL